MDKHCDNPRACIVCSTAPATDADVAALATLAETLASQLRRWASEGVAASIADGGPTVTPFGRLSNACSDVRALSESLDRLRIAMLYGGQS